MPVIPVPGKPGRFKIPNVPGTGTKKEKQKQLKAIQVSKRARRKKK